MKYKTFILALLFASLHASPADVDSVYAEYCLNLKYTDEGLSVILSLVKKYKDLKPISPSRAQEQLKCYYYYFRPSIRFEFIDASGKEIISVSEGDAMTIGRGTDNIREVIQLNLPSDTTGYTFWGLTKEDLLPFKNSVINAYTDVKYECLPHLDTTYRFDFPVKIIGECGCAVSKTRKRHR